MNVECQMPYHRVKRKILLGKVEMEKGNWCRASQFGRMQQALEAEVVLGDVAVLGQKSDRLPKLCFKTSVKMKLVVGQWYS